VSTRVEGRVPATSGRVQVATKQRSTWPRPWPSNSHRTQPTRINWIYNFSFVISLRYGWSHGYENAKKGRYLPVHRVCARHNTMMGEFGLLIIMVFHCVSHQFQTATIVRQRWPTFSGRWIDTILDRYSVMSTELRSLASVHLPQKGQRLVSALPFFQSYSPNTTTASILLVHGPDCISGISKIVYLPTL